ncbi:3'5'-cyclic nucleotide phosphodiesterase family protein [Tritrichomonas foetus]|uniref:3'5'-cyclic nucleotide phosphodiesterase family protein n=1 Tax=Tritrichomonas foetus TaxID=1144522 RepID=A0A1J4JIR0_9EUKA|nr:3'5'-cyclic nucleotide phosphodiesterase family protein [Tritrichomonas foetus]|eukprot:OHS97092.1 3'5'-cyclic nucleotide phosphodiesterase family protein [Tritrichomonas foetus]
MFSKTYGEPISVQKSKKSSLSNTSHPFVTIYKDSTPAPQAIDQFAPYLTKKLTKKRSKVTKSEIMKQKNITASNPNFLLTASPAKPTSIISSNTNKQIDQKNSAPFQFSQTQPIKKASFNQSANSSYNNLNLFRNANSMLGFASIEDIEDLPLSSPLVKTQNNPLNTSLASVNSVATTNTNATNKSSNKASNIKSKKNNNLNNTQINSINPQSSTINMSTVNGHTNSLERCFDMIASGSIETALNRLVEEKLKKYFVCDDVYFYHDISSVQLLYCPSNGAICPHGGGLVGYCHFTRKILSILTVSTHVSYNEIYDSKYCNNDSRGLIFPIFDTQNNIKAIVAMYRNSSKPVFQDSEEKAVEYLQNKFQLYSRWLFQPIISNDTIADLVHVQRVPIFIESLEIKLTRLFNCRTFELWLLHNDTNEIFMFSNSSNDPIPVRTADSGVVGYAMLNSCSISLTSANLHSAYHPRSDGTGEQSVLMIPVKDQDSPIVYGLVLRGKRLPSFFTDLDEKILAQISPLIISSLNSSELVEKSFKSLEDAKKNTDRLHSLLEVAECISGQLHIDSLIESIMNRACDLVKADRCSLFMVSENRDKLVTSFQGGLAESIEIPINAGIVGFTATTGQILNIKDAYEDPRFNRSTDLKTGYKTQNLLCVPIFDDKGNIRGVTEMINKLCGCFDGEDEKLIQVFNVFVGISIENARLYRASIDLSMQLRSILEISQKISQTTTLKQLLENILKNARRVIGAGRAMIYLMDATSKKFDVFAVDEDIDAKLNRLNKNNKDAEKEQSSAKKALIHALLKGGPKASNKFVAAGDDARRHQMVSQVISDKEACLDNNEQYPEDSIIVVPILDNDKNPLGAALMQWKKKDDNGFSYEDLKLLDSFSVFISISLERSRMMAVAAFGEMELKMRDLMGDNDRNEFITPSLLELEKHDRRVIVSRDFNCVEFSKIDPEFIKVGFCIFDSLHVRKPFKLSNQRLFCFLYSMKNTYKKVPYHNWRHAVDVTCFMTHMLLHAKLLGVFTPFEVLALAVSCFCHDAGHDGFSNEYNEKAQTPLAILFHNKSVMETHHCTVAVNVISKDACNVFHTLDKNESNKMWKTVISLILATDMAKHFELIAEARKLLESGDDWKKSETGRLLLMKLLIKAADISNVARKFSLADQWCDVLCEEFFRQGELESADGLDFSAGMRTRDSLNKEKSQIGFYTSVCLPLFETLAGFFPLLKGLVDQIKSNLVIWKDRAQKSQAEKDEQ